MNVLVFTTSVSAPHLVDSVKPLLSSRPEIEEWNFDLEDCDKILRIDSPTENSELLIRLFNENGFECEELTG